MKRKVKIGLFCLLVISTCLAAAGSFAYYNAEGKAHNVITSGNVDIALIEKTLKDDEPVDFPQDGIDGVMPGASVSKIAWVENTGSQSAWVRVHVEKSAKDADGSALDPSVASFVLGEGWLDGGDGYYYYKEALPAGGKKTPLFEAVDFDPMMDETYTSGKIYVTLGAEAVQTANNPVPDGGDARDVSGWPQA